MRSPIVPGLTTRTVVENIKQLRAHRGLSLERLSEQLTNVGHPIRATSLHRLENGQRRVDVDDLQSFADVFGIECARLLATSTCANCLDAPPAGFACKACGRSH